MVMNDKRGISPIIVILLLIIVSSGVGFGAYWLSQKLAPRPSILESPPVLEKPSLPESEEVELPEKPTPSPAIAPASAPSPSPEINFVQEGNILNWDAASETYTENWRLLYEAPGNPALSVDLIFDENSLCDLGQGEEVCVLQKLTNGERARIEGSREGAQVLVINLIKQ